MTDSIPPEDNIDRDSFYSIPEDNIPEDEDDFEYELEAPDEEVLQAQKDRLRAMLNKVKGGVDIDEIFNQQETQERYAKSNSNGFVSSDWASDFSNFRFTIRHMFILTASVAIILTIIKSGHACSAITFLGFVFVGGLFAYSVYKENRTLKKSAQKRQQFYEKHRLLMEESIKECLAEGKDASQLQADYEALDAIEDRQEEAGFTWPRFSLRELFIVFTLCVVVFACIPLVGLKFITFALGALALLGLVMYVSGVTVPPLVVFCWWLVLLFYILLSVLAMFMPAEA